MSILSPDVFLHDSGLKLLDLLGRGGQAEVWRCYDTRVHREVAAKLLVVPMGQRSEDTVRDERRRMEREIEHLACVRHENVVELYAAVAEVLEEDHLVTGYVMEISPWGDATSDLVLRRSSFEGTLTDYMRGNLCYAVHFLCQLARGLRAIHEHDLVHADIKPANILCFEMDSPPYVRLKLTDFGMTRLIGQSQQDAYGGTPAYMPPEQGEGGAVKRSDVYALGMTFFEMLTGRLRLDFDGCGSDLEAYREVHKNQRHLHLADEGIECVDLDRLLDEMTRPSESERRDIAGVVSSASFIETLMAEADLPRTLDESVPRFLLAPEAHHERSERLRFVLVDLDRWGVRDRVLGMLRERFGDRASKFELFGDFDLLVRIWLSDDDWGWLRETLAGEFRHVPEGEAYEFHTAKEIRYLWAPTPIDPPVDLEKAMKDHGGKLLELERLTRRVASAEGDQRIRYRDDAIDLAKELQGVGLVLRQIEPDPERSYRAYIFLHPAAVQLQRTWTRLVELSEGDGELRSAAERWKMTLHLSDAAIIVKVVTDELSEVRQVIEKLRAAYLGPVWTKTYLDTQFMSYISDGIQW